MTALVIKPSLTKIQENKENNQMKNKYQKEKTTNRSKEEQIMGSLASYAPSKINPNRRFRMGPYCQQQEEEHTETTYGRFIH